VAVILIGVESQEGGNQDSKNYDDCRSHRFSGILSSCMISPRLATRLHQISRSVASFIGGARPILRRIVGPAPEYIDYSPYEQREATLSHSQARKLASASSQSLPTAR
jgi:hypothetical protein